MKENVFLNLLTYSHPWPCCRVRNLCLEHYKCYLIQFKTYITVCIVVIPILRVIFLSPATKCQYQDLNTVLWVQVHTPFLFFSFFFSFFSSSSQDDGTEQKHLIWINASYDSLCLFNHQAQTDEVYEGSNLGSWKGCWNATENRMDTLTASCAHESK